MPLQLAGLVSQHCALLQLSGIIDPSAVLGTQLEEVLHDA